MVLVLCGLLFLLLLFAIVFILASGSSWSAKSLSILGCIAGMVGAAWLGIYALSYVASTTQNTLMAISSNAVLGYADGTVFITENDETKTFRIENIRTNEIEVPHIITSVRENYSTNNFWVFDERDENIYVTNTLVLPEGYVLPTRIGEN